jgi:uncharacterized protein YndB with AHSA1/START domain
MISTRFETTIARPPDEVWAYAADLRRHPEWMGIRDAELVSGDPTVVGAVGRESMRIGPRTYELTLTVGAAVPGRLITWRFGGAAPLEGEARLELEPIDTGTRATWSSDIRLRGLWRLAQPLLAAEVRSGEAAELEKLKAILEARSDTLPAPEMASASR